MSVHRCPGCDYIYDEANGAAREGFPPGTAWHQIPDDWACPDCAVREKVDFVTVASEATGNVTVASEATENDRSGESR